MLSEVKQPRADGVRSRRWYRSEAADLYIWSGGRGEITAFEYCYRTAGGEYSVLWDIGRGFEFGGIDDGESSPLKNRSPIRVHDGRPPWGLIARHFRREARGLEPGVFRFILDRLVDAAHAG